MTDAPGIYKIVNAVNGRVYIGCAVNLRQRWHSHRGALLRGEHHNAHLQSAWRKYGAAAFTMRPLLVCAKSDLVFYEQRCIDAFDAVANGYNKCPIAGTTAGRKVRPEVVAAMAASKRGVAMTPEAKAAHAAAMARPETRSRISAAKKGIAHKTPVSDAHRAALGAAQKGHAVSEATRAKLAAANLGKKKGPHTPETRLKISLAQKGRPLSAEHVAALCAAQQRRRLAEKAAS
jgi:group I intron endonuclease